MANIPTNQDSCDIQRWLASEIFYIFTIAASKCSVILLVRRLFSNDMAKQRLVCDVFLAVSLLWAVASSIALGANCNYRVDLGAADATCNNMEGRWIGINVIDIITEVGTLVLTLGLVWQLQMSWKNKAHVVVAFLFRLP